MLKLENVQAGYGNILAIKNVSLEIQVRRDQSPLSVQTEPEKAQH
jgi:ABC-type branched-subunit amino acid transport system ATPase component